MLDSITTQSYHNSQNLIKTTLLPHSQNMCKVIKGNRCHFRCHNCARRLRREARKFKNRHHQRFQHQREPVTTSKKYVGTLNNAPVDNHKNRQSSPIRRKMESRATNAIRAGSAAFHLLKVWSQRNDNISLHSVHTETIEKKTEQESRKTTSISLQLQRFFNRRSWASKY